MNERVEIKVSKSIENIFIWWSGNSYYPEYAVEYKDSLDENDCSVLREDMKEILRRKIADCILLNNITNDMGFEEDRQATLFFQEVYNYLFEDGPEPDISDYLA